MTMCWQGLGGTWNLQPRPWRRALRVGQVVSMGGSLWSVVLMGAGRSCWDLRAIGERNMQVLLITCH
jgi:hypothetical protein